MRIVSGIYSKTKLVGDKIKGTRPTMDRVKESLIATLNPYIKDALVLDLFAGSGSLGIEAISSGASFVYFNDLNNECLKAIEQNLKTVKVTSYKLLKKDYLKALKTLKEDNLKFDLIFLDPPYKENLINKAINLILEYDLLNDKGLIVCEYEKEIMHDYDTLTILKDKKYGSTFIRIYQKENII